MTVKGWNAQQYHKKMSKQTARKPWFTMATIAVLVVAGGVSAVGIQDDKIGICHKAGDGYVKIVVAEDSFEHGHARHNPDTYFIDPAATCEDPSAVTPAVPEVPAHEPQDNATSAPGNETIDGGNETADVGNGTSPGGVNETAPPEADGADDAPADDAPAEESPGNEDPDAAGEEDGEPEAGEGQQPSANETEAEPPFLDARVTQEAFQDAEQVVLHIMVENIGEGALEVSLADALPDVRRTWYLTGPDASSCVLDGRDLSCWFDLDVGAAAAVELSAFTDRMACGFALTNTAQIAAEGDSDGRNDASSAGIAARPC